MHSKFLNLENQPVSLYGGKTNAAVIGTERSIIPIGQDILYAAEYRAKTAFLLEGEKAASVACCANCYIDLSKSGRVFRAESSNELLYEEVEELRGKEIIEVSGVDNHCFAVC